LEQGYRNIGHISGPLEWWEARQRMKAWKDVLNEAGFPVENGHCVAGNWSSSSGATAVEKLLNQYPEMDAVFVANDQMALSVLHVINQRGLRIPEDIGVVGFDNIPESAYFWPSLTTVQQDQYRVAKVAVEEMIKIIESGRNGLGPIEPCSILLEPTLVVRRSSSRLETVRNKGGG
jgi:LacI family transcriptional regulator